jgi:hypothetical protein
MYSARTRWGVFDVRRCQSHHAPPAFPFARRRRKEPGDVSRTGTIPAYRCRVCPVLHSTLRRGRKPRRRPRRYRRAPRRLPWQMCCPMLCGVAPAGASGDACPGLVARWSRRAKSVRTWTANGRSVGLDAAICSTARSRCDSRRRPPRRQRVVRILRSGQGSLMDDTSPDHAPATAAYLKPVERGLALPRAVAPVVRPIGSKVVASERIRFSDRRTILSARRPLTVRNANVPPGSAGARVAPADVMVIQAAEQFRCAHVYIACPRDTPWAFVCHRRGRRAQALLLGARVPSHAVVAFPERAAMTAPTRIDRESWTRRGAS